MPAPANTAPIQILQQSLQQCQERKSRSQRRIADMDVDIETLRSVIREMDAEIADIEAALAALGAPCDPDPDQKPAG